MEENDKPTIYWCRKKNAWKKDHFSRCKALTEIQV